MYEKESKHALGPDECGDAQDSIYDVRDSGDSFAVLCRERIIIH